MSVPIPLRDVPAAPFTISTLGSIRQDLADDEVFRSSHRFSAEANALPVEEKQHT